MKTSVVCLTASLMVASGSACADPAKLSGIVTDVFGPHFVVDTASGKVLVDIGPKGTDKVTIKSGEKVEIEGDRHRNELRAHRVTLADGHVYELGKPGKSWREWLLGKPAADDAAAGFDPDDAKKIASDKGYQVTGDPVATKKHFRVMATKDGKSLELDVHRDGNVVEHVPFGEPEAKKLAADNGYEVVGDLHAVDEHFELLGKKDGKYYELHAHRDGNLVRDHIVVAGDPKWGPSIN